MRLIDGNKLASNYASGIKIIFYKINVKLVIANTLAWFYPNFNFAVFV